MREKKYKYTLGQYVTYRKVGICKIVDIIYQNFAGQGGAEYYVLCSVYDNNTKVFVPVDSALENEMKEMLSVDEINNIIDISKNVDIIWKDDCRERAAVFEDIITSGDKAKMIWLIKRVSELKSKIEQEKKKMKANDTKYLVLAENIISGDFAYALGIAKNQVMDYINMRLES